MRAYYEANAPKQKARGVVSLADLAGMDCEEVASRGKSSQHVNATKHAWRRLTEHFGANTSPRKVDYDAVVQFIAARRAVGVRGQSIVREVQALHRGLRIANRKGWLPVLPQLPKVGVDPPKETQAGKLHPLDVIARWLLALPQDARDQAEFVLLTGLRRTECERLCLDWVEGAAADTGVPALLRVPAGAAKGKRERVIGLVAEALAILHRKGAGRIGSDPVFGSVDHKTAFHNACKAIGYGKRIHLRDLRHFFTTVGTAQTGDAVAAQAALGHARLSTTQKYLHSTMQRTASVSVQVAQTVSRHRSVGTGGEMKTAGEEKPNENKE